MKIEELTEKINSKTVTTEDFNLFIENLPKGADERRMRTSQRLPKKTHRMGNPATTASHIARRGDINTPSKTPRGRKAVERRGIENKKNADEFRRKELQLEQLEEQAQQLRQELDAMRENTDD